jgi:FkbM family methyltransferase
MNPFPPSPSKVFKHVREVSGLAADEHSRQQLSRNMVQANLKRTHDGWAQLANRFVGTGKAQVQLKLPGLARFSYRPGTTDLLVLEQVFVDREYDVDSIDPNEVEYILDLGSNIGVTAMLWAQRYPNARMILVEPDPENFELLKENTEAFKDRCLLLNAAVSNECGHTSFFRSEREYGHSIIKTEDCVSELRVETMTVPAILRRAGFPRVDLLKMDIEGGEELVMPTIDQWGMGVRYFIAELHEPYGIETFTNDCQRGGLRTDARQHVGCNCNLPFAVSNASSWALA